MHHEYLWEKQSFRRRSTRLYCPNGHELQQAITIDENNQATLACGCHRERVLSLAENHFSVEHILASSESIRRKAQDLFPIVAPNFDWQLELAS